jgi:hypothetical protein
MISPENEDRSRIRATASAKGSKPEPTRSPAIMELCAVITDYGFSSGRFSSISAEEAPSSRDLERDLRIAFNAFQQSRFTASASRIAMLIADTHLASQQCKETERARVSQVLALSYQAAASVLAKVGQPDIGWIAAERGLHIAERYASPPVRASLIRQVAFALHSTGRFEPAMDLWNRAQNTCTMRFPVMALRCRSTVHCSWSARWLRRASAIVPGPQATSRKQTAPHGTWAGIRTISGLLSAQPM